LKPITLTVHAEHAIKERDLDRIWIERAVRKPDWREPDSSGAERRFRAIPERDGRILRVVCAETDTEVRVITVFLDRKARRP
jgi:hypothetical protein